MQGLFPVTDLANLPTSRLLALGGRQSALNGRVQVNECYGDFSPINVSLSVLLCVNEKGTPVRGLLGQYCSVRTSLRREPIISRAMKAEEVCPLARSAIAESVPVSLCTLHTRAGFS
jgi:hypothetical protein